MLSCENVTLEGCCTAAQELYYCENGTISTLDCGGGGSTCGWNAGASFYDCNQSGADPSGANPYLCPGESECTPNCAGKLCGGDGCGGSCGGCPSGSVCGPSFTCVEDAGTCESNDDCAAGELCNAGTCITNGCGSIVGAGCCDGTTLKYCTLSPDEMSTELVTIPCPDSCGWDAGNAYYECGFSGAEPTGQLPLACPAP